MQEILPPDDTTALQVVSEATNSCLWGMQQALSSLSTQAAHVKPMVAGQAGVSSGVNYEGSQETQLLEGQLLLASYQKPATDTALAQQAGASSMEVPLASAQAGPHQAWGQQAGQAPVGQLTPEQAALLPSPIRMAC